MDLIPKKKESMAFKKKQQIFNTCAGLSGIKVLEFPSLILQMSYFCHISINKGSGGKFARNKNNLIRNNFQHKNIHFVNYNRILTLVNFFFKYVASSEVP